MLQITSEIQESSARNGKHQCAFDRAFLGISAPVDVGGLRRNYFSSGFFCTLKAALRGTRG
jgi:hypothetical protein